MSFMDVLRIGLSTWTRRRRGKMDCDDLSSLRKICKARPCAKLVGVINADTVAIGHVNGSHQLGRVLHEVITISILGDASARVVHIVQ